MDTKIYQRTVWLKIHEFQQTQVWFTMQIKSFHHHVMLKMLFKMTVCLMTPQRPSQSASYRFMPIPAMAPVCLCVRTHVRWLILKRLTLLIFEEWLRTERSHTHTHVQPRETRHARIIQSPHSCVNKHHSWISFSLNVPPSTKHSKKTNC